MDAKKLVRMANEIAAFFEADPDPAVSVEGVTHHLKRFWDPRMRKALFRHLDESGETGLKASVVAALQTHRNRLLPADVEPRNQAVGSEDQKR